MGIDAKRIPPGEAIAEGVGKTWLVLVRSDQRTLPLAASTAISPPPAGCAAATTTVFPATAMLPITGWNTPVRTTSSPG